MFSTKNRKLNWNLDETKGLATMGVRTRVFVGQLAWKLYKLWQRSFWFFSKFSFTLGFLASGAKHNVHLIIVYKSKSILQLSFESFLLLALLWVYALLDHEQEYSCLVHWVIPLTSYLLWWSLYSHYNKLFS